MTVVASARRAPNLESFFSDALRTKKITKWEFDQLVRANRLLRKNSKPPFSQLMRWRETIVRLTGKPPPLAALITGNNHAFLPVELQGLYRTANAAALEHNRVVRRTGNGTLNPIPSPRQWAAALALSDASKLSPATRELRRLLIHHLRQFLGDDYQTVIRLSRGSVRLPVVFCGAIPTPRYRTPEDLRTTLKALLDPGTLGFYLRNMNARLREATLERVRKLGVDRFVNRLLANEGMKRVLVNIGHIHGQKGWMFERYCLPHQIDKLRDFINSVGPVSRKRMRKQTFLILGLQVRVRDPETGRLSGRLQFKDGAIVSFHPRSGKTTAVTRHDFEAKSGADGDWNVVSQNEKWTDELPDGSELVIDQGALVYQINGKGVATRVNPRAMFDRGSLKKTKGHAERRRKPTKKDPSRWEFAFAVGGEIVPLEAKARRTRTAVEDRSGTTVFLPDNVSQLSLDTRDFFPSDIGQRTLMPVRSDEMDFYARSVLQEVIIGMASGKLEPSLPEYMKVYGFKK